MLTVDRVLALLGVDLKRVQRCSCSRARSGYLRVIRGYPEVVMSSGTNPEGLR